MTSALTISMTKGEITMPSVAITQLTLLRLLNLLHLFLMFILISTSPILLSDLFLFPHILPTPNLQNVDVWLMMSHLVRTLVTKKYPLSEKSLIVYTDLDQLLIIGNTNRLLFRLVLHMLRALVVYQGLSLLAPKFECQRELLTTLLLSQRGWLTEDTGRSSEHATRRMCPSLRSNCKFCIYGFCPGRVLV